MVILIIMNLKIIILREVIHNSVYILYDLHFLSLQEREANLYRQKHISSCLWPAAQRKMDSKGAEKITGR